MDIYYKKYIKYKKKFLTLKYGTKQMTGGSKKYEIVNVRNVVDPGTNPIIVDNLSKVLKNIFCYWSVDSKPSEIKEGMNKDNINIDLGKNIIFGIYRIILYCDDKEKIFYSTAGKENGWTNIEEFINDINQIYSILIPVGLVPEIDELLDEQLLRGREKIRWQDYSDHIYIDCIAIKNYNGLIFIELLLGS